MSALKEAKRLGEVAVPCGLALVGGSGAANDFLVGREDAPQVFEHGGRECWLGELPWGQTEGCPSPLAS